MTVRIASSAAILAGFALAAATAAPASAGRCVTKGGSATGITKEFAMYEAELIIRQVTGNWPLQTDKISKPVSRCRNDGGMWTCRATVEVCKG